MLQKWIFVLSVCLFGFLESGSGGATALPKAATRSHPVLLNLASGGDSRLREQLLRLTDALNRRDLNAIRPQISAARIYVEIADKEGAYLSNSQTMVVMESFFRTRSSISSTFDFVSDDGTSGSASGTLMARKDGKSVSYKLNFGFTKNDKGVWTLTRISMR